MVRGESFGVLFLCHQPTNSKIKITWYDSRRTVGYLLFLCHQPTNLEIKICMIWKARRIFWYFSFFCATNPPTWKKLHVTRMIREESFGICFVCHQPTNLKKKCVWYDRQRNPRTGTRKKMGSGSRRWSRTRNSRASGSRKWSPTRTTTGRGSTRWWRTPTTRRTPSWRRGAQTARTSGSSCGRCGPSFNLFFFCVHGYLYWSIIFTWKSRLTPHFACPPPHPRCHCALGCWVTAGTTSDEIVVTDSLKEALIR